MEFKIGDKVKLKENAGFHKAFYDKYGNKELIIDAVSIEDDSIFIKEIEENGSNGWLSNCDVINIENYHSAKHDKDNAWNTQVEGNYYTKLAIQPMEYSMKNKLNPLQHTIIKYITRYKDKNGKIDLEKAIHCIEMLIDLEYKDENK